MVAVQRWLSLTFADAEGVPWRTVRMLPVAIVPSLHHRKEGWPSDEEKVAKHPLIARPGWFSDSSERTTTPSAPKLRRLRSILLIGAATPPCGEARRGLSLASRSSRPPAAPYKTLPRSSAELKFLAPLRGAFDKRDKNGSI